MWLTLPLAVTLLAPAQPPQPPAGGLTLTNVRGTYGLFGGTRPAGPLLPGDALFLAFDIGGVRPNTEGKVTYTMEMVVKDAAGKAVFQEKPFTRTDDVPLGGATLPGIAFTFIGFEQPAGNYTLTLTVTDDAKRAATFNHPFTVAAKGLGVVMVGTFLDDRGQFPVPNGGFVGQTLICHFNVVGFNRDDPATRPGAPKAAPNAPKLGLQPNVSAEMVVTENGKPVLPRLAVVTENGKAVQATPTVVKVEGGLKEDEQVFNLRYAVPLSRPGKFAVTMNVTDNITKKTASFTLPITVSPPPG